MKIGKLRRKFSSIFIIAMILFSCEFNKEKNNANSISVQPEINSKKMEIEFTNHLMVDSSLVISDSINLFSLSNGMTDRNVAAICQCEKDSQNRISIQIISAIPTKKELAEGINDNSRVLMGRLNPVESFSGQMKFITFNLKDSLVSKIQFLSKSSKVEYEESDFKYSDISRYQISISTFDFAVASQVFGTYKLVLDEEFGYFDNDTIVKGTFKCINSRIQKFKEIQEWNIPEWNKKKKEKWGIQLNK